MAEFSTYEEMAKEVAEKALDEFTYKDKTLREWIEIIVAQDLLAIEELEKIKAEIREWYWQADKQKISKDPCVVDAMTDLFIRTVDNHISELKGENNG